MNTVAPIQPEQPSALADLSARLPVAARVVAVGASAGGLQALSLILATLPADFRAPVLVVQHLSPDFPSQLAHILGRHTDLHVKQAEQGDRIQAGHVYVAPPDRHLLACADGTLALTHTHKVHHCRPSVDVLFTSLAASFGARAVGVVLTGGDGDGAAGCQAIKAEGGVTFAQDLFSSQQPSMPRSAAATGAVDQVLPLTDIAAALVTLTGPEKALAPDKKGGAEKNGSQAASPDRDKITRQVRARRERVASLLARAEATPTASGLLEAAASELAACAGALGVAEEALRVQADVITSYRLALEAEALRLPTR